MVNIDTILNLLCVGYPCIASYRAVKTRDAEGYKQWIVYWVIYTLIQIFEMLGDLILSWFPLYYEIKLAFMIWLTLPIFRGASTIYHNVLAPYLIRYESKIDEGLDGMWSQVEETAGVLKTDGVRLARSNSAAIFSRAQELVSQKMGGDSVSPRPTALPSRSCCGARGPRRRSSRHPPNSSSTSEQTARSHSTGARPGNTTDGSG